MTDGPVWGKYGRRPLVILALVAMVDAVDRQILPGVLTKVQEDLGFSDFQAGLLGGAPILAGFLVALPRATSPTATGARGSSRSCSRRGA